MDEWIRPPLAATSLGEREHPIPIVVVLGWMGAKPHNLRHFGNLYVAVGATVLMYSPGMMSTWVSSFAEKNAKRILELLLGEVNSSGQMRPILFANFSGSAKTTYYKVLQVGYCRI